MATFSVYSGSSISGLVNSFVEANSGIAVDANSIQLHASGVDAINFYDGSQSSLGIGSGLLLTSGTTPGTSKTMGWFGTDNTQYFADGTSTFFNGDADIDAVVNTVFQTQSYDATTLSFNFTVTDPMATSVSFDLVFGSDEYPEWVDQFVDCAVIIVNGVNYAFFNHDPNAPLSVIGPNLAAGYFQDNAGSILPIEYDGISHVLKIVAPIKVGEVNTIKIGVADTGDHILDSGMFIANMVAGTTPGSGVVITPDVPCTQGNDTVTGTIADELINLLDGDDIAYAGGGDDIVVAGAGNDKVYGGTGNDTLEGDQGNDLLDGGEGASNEAVYKGASADFAVGYDAATGKYTLDDNGTDTNDEGVDSLTNIQLVKFSDGLFDLTANGLFAHVDNTGGGANTPGSVALSGLALPGHALSAIVVDANGFPSGAVAYQWLTSADGKNWTDTGVTSQSYSLTNADAGHQIMATASYTDKTGHAELASSAGTLVAAPTGDVTIQPMALSTPAGGSVANPLTTLIQNATDLGYTQAMAENSVKAALGLPDIDLRTYDAYAILTANPADATALAVMKIAAEVAMTASVSDPSGYNLAIAVLQAADQGTVLDLTDPATLDTLLAGVDANLHGIVEGLNKDMGDTTSFTVVNKVWNDWAGQADNLKPYIDHLETISVHINQAPEGICNANLAAGMQDQAYTILASDLLSGFTDPEGAGLSVTGVSVDVGGTVTDNSDGTFTFTPNGGYNGPVELTFTVSDPDGASIAGNTMLIIDASATSGDITAPTATIASAMVGTVNGDVSFTVSFSEAVNALDATSFTASHGTIASVTETGGVYTVVVTPESGYEGQVQLTLPAGAASDLAGNPINSLASASQSVDTLSPTVSIADNTPGTAAGSVTYTLTFSEAVIGLAADDIVVTHGTVASVSGGGKTWNVVVNPEAGFEGTMGFSVNEGAVTDALSNASAAAFAEGQAIDTNAPTVTTFAPADGATAVGTGSDIVVSFSEAVKLGTGTIAIHAGSTTGAVLESFDVATSARVTLSGTTLTVNPASTLADGAQYFVTFSAGVVTDMAGNAFAGTDTYDFTTAAAQPLNLSGTVGADVLIGGSASDTLKGLGGTDTMDGRDGSDVYIIGTAGEHAAAEIADTGNTGIDEVRFTATGTATLTLYAGDTGIELATAAPGSAALSINAAAVLNGLTIQGNAGANTLTGTNLDDVLIGGAGNDMLNGGNGNDTASYADQTSAVTVNLSVTKAQNTGAAGSDTLKSIENLIGGSGNDVLTGSLGANRIEGGAGNDTIDGGAGADRLLGGDGADTMLAGAGSDGLWGGLGADTFVFKAIADSAISGPDIIWDFSHAEADKIDLRSIDANSVMKGNQAFTLATSFSHKSGELVIATEGDHYLVQGDVNGDGVADFVIALHSATSLWAGDFLL